MNSMNKQVQESTIQSQNEWNACLLFRNKQLTKEVKELRSVSAAMDCSCLLYTSDAADELLCVIFGGLSIILKKKTQK